MNLRHNNSIYYYGIKTPMIFHVVKTDKLWPYTLQSAIKNKVLNNDNIDLVLDDNGDTLFKVICEENKRTALYLLSKFKVNVNFVSKNNESCLMAAILTPDRIEYNRINVITGSSPINYERKVSKEEIKQRNQLIDELFNNGASFSQTLSLLSTCSAYKKKLFYDNFEIYKTSHQNTQFKKYKGQKEKKKKIIL